MHPSCECSSFARRALCLFFRFLQEFAIHGRRACELRCLRGGVMLGVSYRGRQLRIGGAKAGPVEIVCILLTFGYMGFLVWTAAKSNGLA